MDAWQERKMSAAVNTLYNKGYTYEGGEQWKPPIGQAPKWVTAPAPEYVFVSGPSDYTICENKYAEILIRIMCLQNGDNQSEYTVTTIPGPNIV